MKSNKLTDFTKYFKPCLIVTLILVVVCSVLVAVFGFNKGLDITGGTQLVVDFSLTDVKTEDDRQLGEAQQKLKNILSNKGVIINSFQVQGEYNSKQFVVTFKETSNDRLNDIRIAINNEFNTSSEYQSLGENDKNLILDKNADLTKKTTHIDSFISSTALISIISSLLFLTVVVMIYAMFRVKVKGSAVIGFGAMLDILLTLCFIVLSRIQINRYIFVALALILCYSLYESVNLMLSIKDNAKNPHNVAKSNKEVANLTVQSLFRTNLFITLGIVVLALIWCIFGTSNVLYTLLSICTGVVVVLGTHTFVLPAFWVAIAKQKETFTKQGVIAVSTTNQEVEVQKSYETDEDEQAEVVEIEDDGEQTNGENI